MREVTVLSNAKSRMTVLYECRVCHRALEAVADVKRGEQGASEGAARGRQTWRDVKAYHESMREPRPLPERAEEQPQPQAEPKPRATPIRPSPRVRFTRRSDRR